MAEEQTNQSPEEQKEESSEEVKPEEVKEEETKTEEAPVEEKKEEAKPEEPKKEEAKPEEPKKEEAPKQEKKEEEPKEEEPKEEEPKEEEEEVEVPKKFKKLVEEIEEMSVLDLAELVKILEKKFGVSAAAPVAMAPAGAPAGGDAGAGEEKSVFNIELTGIGDKKIEVIKAVRDITEKGLKEAKDLVDAAASAPQMVKENVKKDDAEEIKKKLTDAGATVELK